jgi:rhodanese-related sulfurtransferase
MSTTDQLDPHISMGELTARFPGARRALFRRYHIGGCSSCGFAPEETLAQVCARNNAISVEEVVEHILQSHESDLQMQLSPAEAAECLRSQPGARLLDIRTREEFDAVHVPGAVFFSQELMHEIMQRWNRAELLAILDHRGARSMDAAAYFAGHGFTQAKAVRGGMDAWSVEVDPDLPRYELE